jgi:3-methyladenine DNA glycosylase Tag
MDSKVWVFRDEAWKKTILDEEAIFSQLVLSSRQYGASSG